MEPILDHPILTSAALLAISAFSFTHADDSIPENAVPSIIVSTVAEPVAQGKFAPSWESIKHDQVSE